MKLNSLVSGQETCLSVKGGEGGRCGLVEKVQVGHIIQNALHRVRSLGTCRNDYLQYVMNLIALSGWFDAINNKATIAHFTVEKFGSLMIPFPSLSEQTAIVQYLDQADERIRRYVSSRSGSSNCWRNIGRRSSNTLLRAALTRCAPQALGGGVAWRCAGALGGFCGQETLFYSVRQDVAEWPKRSNRHCSALSEGATCSVVFCSYN